MALGVEDILRILSLVPLPREGGFFRETHRSELVIPKEALPLVYTGPRHAGTAIYYLLTPDTASLIHRLPGDEVFHFYLGDPVEMLLLHPDGRGYPVVIGSDLQEGMEPQLVVPAGVWQGSRLAPGGRFALMGTTMAPGFDSHDFELAKRAVLLRKFPEYADLIHMLTAEE